MKTKVLTSIIALTISGMTVGGVAQAATESETTIQRSTRVDVVPGPAVKQEESTSTTTTKGILGREKTQTTTSKSVREGYPEAVARERSETTTSSSTTRDRFPDTNTTVKSRTTVETEKKY